eukprot:2329235-Lingulodinium_polyedra.AAC.1
MYIHLLCQVHHLCTHRASGSNDCTATEGRQRPEARLPSMGKAKGKAKAKASAKAAAVRVQRGGTVPNDQHVKVLVAKTLSEQMKGLTEYELTCRSVNGRTCAQQIEFDRREWWKMSEYGKTITLSPEYYRK